MAKAPVGAIVAITYDSTDTIEVGDYLVTSTGRAYRVLAATLQQRGRWAGRKWTISAIVDMSVPADATRHALRWHPRGRKR